MQTQSANSTISINHPHPARLAQLLTMGDCLVGEARITNIRPITGIDYNLSGPGGFIRFSGGVPAASLALAATVQTSRAGKPLSHPLPVHLVACEDGAIEVHANTILRQRLFTIAAQEAIGPVSG